VLGAQTTDSMASGTTAYQAPERLNGQRRATEATDVYAYACLCVVVSSCATVASGRCLITLRPGDYRWQVSLYR
jgi:serine/threonine protein kinase